MGTQARGALPRSPPSPAGRRPDWRTIVCEGLLVTLGFVAAGAVAGAINMLSFYLSWSAIELVGGEPIGAVNIQGVLAMATVGSVVGAATAAVLLPVAWVTLVAHDHARGLWRASRNGWIAAGLGGPALVFAVPVVALVVLVTLLLHRSAPTP